MIIPYPYDPLTQDLWLYQDQSISWTINPGTSTIKIPYAWNPNSPLYGYRNSLVGMSARSRVMTTPPYSVFPEYDAINPYSDPANRPVWFNSFPMTMLMFGNGMMLSCGHCIVDAYVDRSVNRYCVANGGYQDETYIARLMDYAFRFIDGNNNVTALDPRLVRMFRSDSSAYVGLDSSVIDYGIYEYTLPTSIPSMQVVDPRSLPYDATGWYLDSNHKIIRMKSRLQYVQNGTVYTKWEGVNPDGTAASLPFLGFLHDSGSFAMAEIKAPTSPAAGDGIMGLIPRGIFGPNQIIEDQVDVDLYMNADGDLANLYPPVPTMIREYLAFRNRPALPVVMASREGAPATETVEQQILSLLN